MERRASTARSYLEQMLLDETAEPKALPLSLLEDITGGFSDDQQIGSGGFAVVYKGILGDRAVAVKRLSNVFMHETEFHREVECLMQVKHKNIVRFFGYCADRQGSMEKYNGKFVMADVHQRLLCFEYIPKGSLDKYIIDTCLEWGTCYTIIKGICEGLQYLHENNIIHLDLKPANILLDDNMVPKITDFGVSRCFDENQSRHITKSILGTIGYLAPELCGGVITRSADLYSLGLIIMEILTGQKGHKSIAAVLESWSDRLERSQRATQRKQIRVCYKIALECREFNPKKRPTSARAIVDRLYVSTTLQQIQARKQQTIDIKSEGNMGVAQRSMAMDQSSLYGQGIMQQKPGLGGAGLNQGVSGLPLKGWPLTGIDQLRPNLGAQMQKPFLSTQSQFQLMSPQQQQQLLAQAQVQGLSNSAHYGDMDPRRFTTLTRGGMNGKDGQPGGTDGCISSPMQSSSPKIRPDQEYLMKMQQTSSQQPQEQLQQQQQQNQQQQQQQQQMQQNNRKRKQTTSSGPANSTGTGNTVGPSANSPPSTPSTHTPEGLGMAGNMRHVPKNLMMYGADGAGLASSSNQMDDLEPFGDVGSLDDNVESFLSNDDGDARDIFAALKGGPTEPNPAASKGFTFSEVNCWRTSNSKVVCCNFSYDGKILASAGHEKKAVLWNMDTFQTHYLPEEHTGIITDVRFRPISTQMATSSFDRTIKLWNATDPGYSQHTFAGHNGHVTSLDFHPKKTDLLCSCDGNGEIRYWNVTQLTCVRVIKGGTAQVRFQPNTGQFLAAASENVVSIFDVDTHTKKYILQGHNTEVQSVCWDNTGEYLASVSQDLVKVWSISTGECIHEVSSNGNKFHSCVFHPSYTNLLVIGGYQSMELWNMVKNQSMTVQAHEGLIAALAQSPVTGMVASASHDNSVKLWK